MMTKELKEIKEAIQDFKGNRSFAKREEKNLIAKHNERMQDYDSQSWVDRNFINTLEYRLQTDIYKLYNENFGADTTIQIIYTDGTECNVTGGEIVAGEITPRLQKIAYASLQNGYTILDTLSGNMDNKWDLEDGEQDWEAREEYFNNVERTFGTKWGVAHSV